MFNNSVTMAERMADYLWQKQQVTLNNIANSSTPGFKAQYVTFQDELKNRMLANAGKGAAQMKKGILEASVRMQTKDAETGRMDGNNVNMDVEQVELAAATIQYQMAIDSINAEFSRIRSVLQ